MKIRIIKKPKDQSSNKIAIVGGTWRYLSGPFALRGRAQSHRHHALVFKITRPRRHSYDRHHERVCDGVVEPDPKP